MKFDLDEWKKMRAWYKMTRPSMAKERGISLSSLYRKVKYPEQFSIKEIQWFIDRFGYEWTFSVFFGYKSQKWDNKLAYETQH